MEEFSVSGSGDHEGVVAGEGRIWKMEFGIWKIFGDRAGETRAEFGVGGYSAAEEERFCFSDLHSAHGFFY